jgi:hypothetical protein
MTTGGRAESIGKSWKNEKSEFDSRSRERFFSWPLWRDGLCSPPGLLFSGPGFFERGKAIGK